MGAGKCPNCGERIHDLYFNCPFCGTEVLRLPSKGEVLAGCSIACLLVLIGVLIAAVL